MVAAAAVAVTAAAAVEVADTADVDEPAVGMLPVANNFGEVRMQLRAAESAGELPLDRGGEQNHSSREEKKGEERREEIEELAEQTHTRNESSSHASELCHRLDALFH